MLVNREKTKTELINDGFNRYSLNAKDNLPSWFLEEEAKHYKPNIPVTKEAVAAIRAKQRALDARPIKKVAEAKGRKKMKAAQKLEKAMKKAEGVVATTDMTEREKAQQIEKLMRKGSAKGKERKEVKVVVARGSTKGVKGRPKGVKGRYLMVDSRGKKEVGILDPAHDLVRPNIFSFFNSFVPRSGETRQTRSASRACMAITIPCNIEDSDSPNTYPGHLIWLSWDLKAPHELSRTPGQTTE
jgi:Spb1 C-terminal domain